MICRRCGTLAGAEWRVCPKCGANLGQSRRSTVHCRACGSRVPAGLRVCSVCGQRLRARWRPEIIAAIALVALGGVYALTRQHSATPQTPIVQAAQMAGATPVPTVQPTSLAAALVAPTPTTSAPTAAPPTKTPTVTLVAPSATAAPAATATPQPSATPTTAPTMTPTTAPPTTTPTDAPTTTVTPEPSPVAPSATPSAAPITPTQAAQPTTQPSATTAAIAPSAAPVLLEPATESRFYGRTLKIWLSWEPVRELAEDEWYAVSVRYVAGGGTQYSGTWQKETRWAVSPEIFQKYDPAHPGYEWDVVIMKQTGVKPDGGREGIAISPVSETRIFYWQ